jgi:hydroxymethylbilane synthase
MYRLHRSGLVIRSSQFSQEGFFIVRTLYFCLPFIKCNYLRSSFTIACRGSWLSLAQAEIFKRKVAALYPAVTITITIIETAGDKEQNTPLHLVEGRDFFTREIQDQLNNNQADFAVHSMKDVSSLDFFAAGHYAIIDRELLYDVAIFNEAVVEKIKKSETIIIGTSSPRRSNMATGFLQKALPKLSEQPISITAQSIRGNVDTRLQKLDNGNYDGIILAAAGLNRLLQYEPAKEKVSALLKNKRLMLLPLFECPPAAGQGAIVAETNKENTDAIEILNAINEPSLTNAITKERVYAQRYGYGCSQQFGVFHLDTAATSFTYASGKDDTAATFTEWDLAITLNTEGKNLFAATDHMKDFFAYDFLDDAIVDGSAKMFFVSSHKAIHSEKIKNALQQKKVWVAGTKTWYELAKKAIWVEGCADGLGFEFLSPVFKSPLVDIDTNKIQIITNTSSVLNWKEENINAVGTYALSGDLSEEIKNEIADADIIFWTSFQQYQLCKPFLKNKLQHVCPSGRTAKLLMVEGIKPIIFPTIKSFIDWRKNNFPQNFIN